MSTQFIEISIIGGGLYDLIVLDWTMKTMQASFSIDGYEHGCWISTTVCESWFFFSHPLQI